MNTSKLKELKNKEIARLQVVLQDNVERAMPIKYNKTTVFIIHADMYLHRAVLFKSNDGSTYAVIKNELSNLEKQKELHYVLKNKWVNTFNTEEILEIRKEFEKQQEIKHKNIARENLKTYIKDYIERFGTTKLKDTLSQIIDTES